uniref:RNA helicase n=1 Tax=Globisporangium ultimum (strain ATCC 200006 / CBS 805.95 / DAOM BR144) TaxID=431595 RepID=K3WIQ8_GLOUD
MDARKRGRSNSRSRSRSADRKRSTASSSSHHARRSRSRSASRDVSPSPALPGGIDREEAERIARIAQLAEERAAKRAAEQKLAAERKPADAGSSEPASAAVARKVPVKLGDGLTAGTKANDAAEVKVVFRSKEQRQKEALERLEKKRQEMDRQRKETEDARRQFLQRQRDERNNARRDSRDSGVSRSSRDERYRDSGSSSRGTAISGSRDAVPTSSSSQQQRTEPHDEKAIQAIKDQYLGKKTQKKKMAKASEKFAKNYQFDWEPTEDTSADLNPLYAKRLDVNLLYGRGYRAGVDMREQRKNNSFLNELSQKRQREHRLADEQNEELTKEQLEDRQRERERAMRSMQDREKDRMKELVTREAQTMGTHWSEKPLDAMRERDWRIFREDFDITIKGGKAPSPLRKWSEAAGLPEAVFKAIAELGFERPSPIQMQSIPIGLQRRDIIGIAETGSGKTAAFMIPIIAYIYSLPPMNVSRTGEQGPLALVMAPTRELALQIEQEAIKLCKYTMVGVPEKGQHPIKTLSVVGGQSIEDQAFKLREGVDIIIGTPGRLMDCLENHYLVLNQCNYVVLDEADRMIDMGFEPQVVAVLENMGSLLKSENEEEMEQQLSLAVAGKDHRFRVTTMFSATMPTEVERLAKTFLRHPAIVKIGDEDSGKNKRIDQRVLFMRSSKKKPKLVEVLNGILRGADQQPQQRSRKERIVDGPKIIVFVNIKKECDVVAKMLSHEGFRITILHGGKSQDQREESLRGFREGYCDVLVATDVAGRGLDIPDVTHVVNYDLPSKIQNYTHRIGRTGRAGKEGIAISLLTDDDEEIMYDLKQYLVSTSMVVPQELANHPCAKAAPGARDEKGNVIARSKRDTVIFAK